MKITKTSVLTGIVHTREIEITEEQLKQHKLGKHIQWLCPQLSVDDREFLITGTTPEEWDEAMGEER